MAPHSLSQLVLVPTEFERRQVEPLLRESLNSIDARIELCGFGPIVAAARTARLIGMYRPARVLLVGIAGTLRDDLPIGQATTFREVACDGIGAGSGPSFTSAQSMGWSQWPGDENSTAIHDTIALANSRDASHTLLTVCSASGSAADAESRRQRFPGIAAEDMEGFAVAAACAMEGTKVEIVRGISNTAGDRNKSNWDVAGALQVAAELANTLLMEADA